MKTHELKCHPHFFDALQRGDKNFEIRRNDRNYQCGDILSIRKYDPQYGLIPGETPLHFTVTYIMTDEDFPAIQAGFVIMGIKRIGEPPKVVGVEGKDVAPFLDELSGCNDYRKIAGLPMPRTCQRCGLGKCKYPAVAESELNDTP